MPIIQLNGPGISNDTTVHRTIAIIKIIIPLFTKPRYMCPTPEIMTARRIVIGRLFVNFTRYIYMLIELSFLPKRIDKSGNVMKVEIVDFKTDRKDSIFQGDYDKQLKIL